MRYAEGLIPVISLKLLIKWLWSENPHSKAISINECFLFESSNNGFSIFSFLIYSPTLHWNCFEKSLERWTGWIPRVPDNSMRECFSEIWTNPEMVASWAGTVCSSPLNSAIKISFFKVIGIYSGLAVCPSSVDKQLSKVKSLFNLLG